MLLKPVRLFAIIGACVAVPYVMTNKNDMGKKFKGFFSGDGKSANNGVAAASIDGTNNEVPAAASPKGPGSDLIQDDTPIEGPPVQELIEVFRMDITKQWIYGRWSRKSTSVAHAEWFGIRVTLVTGTRIDDLAGTLTYYFDQSGQVQHISFLGTTGDTSRIVRMVSEVYGLEWQNPTQPGEQLYQKKWNGRAQSELRTSPAPVLWSSSPHSSFTVALELARPGTNKYLPQRNLIPTTAAK